MFEELLPILLECGIGLFEFWDYTLAEMMLIVKTKNNSIKNQQKSEAANIYVLADLIGASVARLMDSKSTFPQIHEVFPHLYDIPEVQRQDWRLAKERMLDFANARNESLRKE